MRLICLTVSHATANVALREKLAIPPRDLDAALAELKTSFPAAEFMILSTCNRTEIYVARATHGHPRIETLLTWWAGRSDVPPEALEAVVDTYTDSDAIGHVFSVAAGLESLVPGEVQILGQLKDAYQDARQAGSTGTLINTLIQSALRAGKEVRHVTGIDQGKVSVASVAIDCVLDHAADLADLNVLSIGAGEMGRLMLQRLVELTPKALWVTNRSADKATQMASQLGAQAVSIDTLDDYLAQADIVLTSTAAAEVILTHARLATMMENRDAPLLIMDIALPRDVAPTAGEIAGVTLYNIDDLDRIVAASMDQRRDLLDAANDALAPHIAGMIEKLHVRRVVPTIQRLYDAMEAMAQEELTAAGDKFADHSDAEEDMAILQRTIRRVIRRTLHPAARMLRKQAGTPQGEHFAQVLKELFELDESPDA
jgi:glutamyl-tRNA reductase